MEGESGGGWGVEPVAGACPSVPDDDELSVGDAPEEELEEESVVDPVPEPVESVPPPEVVEVDVSWVDVSVVVVVGVVVVAAGGSVVVPSSARAGSSETRAVRSAAASAPRNNLAPRRREQHSPRPSNETPFSFGRPPFLPQPWAQHKRKIRPRGTPRAPERRAPGRTRRLWGCKRGKHRRIRLLRGLSAGTPDGLREIAGSDG